MLFSIIFIIRFYDLDFQRKNSTEHFSNDTILLLSTDGNFQTQASLSMNARNQNKTKFCFAIDWKEKTKLSLSRKAVPRIE